MTHDERNSYIDRELADMPLDHVGMDEPADGPELDEDFDLDCDGPDDLSDDGDALASAGHGTDEDYGYADEVM